MLMFKNFLKFFSLASVLILSACSSDGPKLPGEGNPDYAEGQIDLSLNIQLPFFSRATSTLPAERVNSIRIVIVDLGIDSDGNKVEGVNPFVEYNRVSGIDNLKEDFDYVEGDKSIKMNIPRIYADRKKKIYLLLNTEPEEGIQSYLDIQMPDGTKMTEYDQRFFIPDSNGVAPIDNAVFSAPIGSYVQNNIATGEDMMIPMTALHTFTVPTITEIAQKYPTVNAMLTYPLPEDLFVVKTMNKIWLTFLNKTNQYGSDFKALDLMVTKCAISDINHGSSFLFGKSGENGSLFADYNQESINAPWIQWLFDEAKSSQNPNYSPKWLTDYQIPSFEFNKSLEFTPLANATDIGNALVIPASASNGSTVSVSTKNVPIYFPESHTGLSSQQYEMTFTVKQRPAGTDNEWGNEYTYRILSSENSSFYLPSLFRSSEVTMEVTFRTGVTGLDMEVEVIPYGSVTLNPSFGLGK